ncbi:divalent-cation tolerance protein CutA [Streptomyces sp. NPDC002405]|uniref:divalent-cation tolerance protein CutA n=1 Tax=unclassified Streptomyces TaxID=2593676 RepID=UPI0036CC5016
MTEPEDETEYLQLSIAMPEREQAVALARGAVQGRLAAGSQIIGPVVSMFWHLGEFGEREEWRLLLTTTEEQYPELGKYLMEHHPWENPEGLFDVIPVYRLPYSS